MRKLLIGLLGAGFAAAVSTSALADAAAGKGVFDAKGCAGCHYTQGPAREKTISDQLAKKGPELWYAGSKFQGEWLTAWLATPTPIRLMKFGSLTEENLGGHPALAGGDAALVGAFLMSLTSDVVVADSVRPKNNPKGRLIFTKKMPCSGCHQYEGRGGALAGGRSGPTLVGAGDRLNPDWILAYLMEPKTFKPVKRMPVFTDLMSEKDMTNVAAYVASFVSEE